MECLCVYSSIRKNVILSIMKLKVSIYAIIALILSTLSVPIERSMNFLYLALKLFCVYGVVYHLPAVSANSLFKLHRLLQFTRAVLYPRLAGCCIGCRAGVKTALPMQPQNETSISWACNSGYGSYSESENVYG